MQEIKFTAEIVSEIFSKLRADHATDPSRLKFLDANERAINRETDSAKQSAVYAEMLKQLEHWDEQPTNPLIDQELDIKGFAALLTDIRDYESDTFSSSGAKLSEAEVVLIANQLVDNWKETHLDGVQIAAALDDIRAEDEFALELRGSAKKQ